MNLEKCPKCSRVSLIKTPHGKIMRNQLHIADEYSVDCLNKKCGYTTGIIRVNTEYGDYFDLPWYKRIFKTIKHG